VIDYDRPEDLAAIVAAAPRPILIGLDVDGVLAPIVAHADEATLLDGMADAIDALAACEDTIVAVVSGRSVADLERFGFGRDLVVIGSHGMETRDRPLPPLDDAEADRLDTLDVLAAAAADRAGPGAWVERKPASVVLHVRQADPAAGGDALDRLRSEVSAVPGATTKAGNGVLELFARHADKGSALVALGANAGAATTVFVGDDLTDEEAFGRLSPTDIAVKVGDADTIANHRLSDPPAVLKFLRALPHPR
jgi:trehalose 6-phosphate phosphatase